MKKMYGGVNGEAVQIKKLYGGVNGEAVKIKKVYVGVNGYARQVFQSGKTKLAKPTVSGSYTYNGNVKSPVIYGYDPSTMNMSGTDETANAGTYTLTFTLKDTTSYEWQDGTTGAVTGTWTIAQKAANVGTWYIYDIDQTYYTTASFKNQANIILPLPTVAGRYLETPYSNGECLDTSKGYTGLIGFSTTDSEAALSGSSIVLYSNSQHTQGRGSVSRDYGGAIRTSQSRGGETTAQTWYLKAHFAINNYPNSNYDWSGYTIDYSSTDSCYYIAAPVCIKFQA